jgi:hypothetical protein
MGQSRTKHVFRVLVLLALIPVAEAERTPKRADHDATAHAARRPTSSRLLTSDEGLKIIRSAHATRHKAHSNGDCSHVVHAIYKRAGFPYRYADSEQLYDGTEHFRQVSLPQAGDLAVWHGHAGIVVNPAQHSFFGATSSGLRVEFYDSRYWKHRGKPRFFRYVKSSS